MTMTEYLKIADLSGRDRLVAQGDLWRKKASIREGRARGAQDEGDWDRSLSELAFAEEHIAKAEACYARAEMLA